MDAQTVLVIILSTTLAIFLILGIVAMVLFIQIIRHVKRMMEKAEHVAENLSTAAQYIKPASMAAALMRFVKKSKRSKKGEDDE